METIYSDLTTTHTTLTKDAIRAMKKAEGILFCHSHKQSKFESPFFIRCVMETKTGKFKIISREEIQIEGSFEGKYGMETEHTRTAAFAHNFQPYGNFSGWLEFLKPNDRLIIRFMTNDNQYCRDANLERNDCNLIVDRKGKRFYFKIDVSITPSESLAKMVMTNHWNEY